ncbi:MAG: hypothetical protein P8J18_07690 [Halieaceae bacterium]|nr:hypothetical protein [Halieaceae bacterium]
MKSRSRSAIVRHCEVPIYGLEVVGKFKEERPDNDRVHSFRLVTIVFDLGFWFFSQNVALSDRGDPPDNLEILVGFTLFFP